jgi:Zn-dependent peptidase ImmA (M78 family)
MRALARRVRTRQEAAVELYALLDEDPPWGSIDVTFTDDPDFLAGNARELLGVSLADQKAWRDPSGYLPLRAWIDAIEELGVLVMQDGTLPVEEMRGFASTHASVPAIVINTNDDPRARAFTAVHEFGHLLRARAGRGLVPTAEQWCNDFASGVLMPRDSFARDFERAVRGRSLLRAIESVALDYGVTPYAAAVRVARLGLAPQDDVDVAIHEIQERGKGRERQAGGGNYYLTTVGRLGPSFIRLVFSALDTQGVTYPAASGLLGVKVNNFEKLRERAEERVR